MKLISPEETETRLTSLENQVTSAIGLFEISESRLDVLSSRLDALEKTAGALVNHCSKLLKSHVNLLHEFTKLQDNINRFEKTMISFFEKGI